MKTRLGSCARRLVVPLTVVVLVSPLPLPGADDSRTGDDGVRAIGRTPPNGLSDLAALAGFEPVDPILALNDRPADRLPAARGARADLRGIYRKVGPATVVVYAPLGHGSGVIVDPAGWVVTNHHVVKDATSPEDLELKLTVEVGTMSAAGWMTQGKRYDAVVHKIDPLHDIAILKILKPPPGLPSVRLASTAPLPGDAAVAIGHGSSGLLWSMKIGAVAAVGPITSAARIAFHCTEMTEKLSGKTCAAISEHFTAYKDSVAAKQGLAPVIQTTCHLSPGDSGGPLVNSKGELIGLNAFGLNQTGDSNFHVHLDSVRTFLKTIPTAPHRDIPDPWASYGETTLRDVDLDGVIDMLEIHDPGTAGRSEIRTALMDLDQDSFKAGGVPTIAELVGKRSFDYEVAVVQNGKSFSYLYDTSGDGNPDLLMTDPDGDGDVDSAHRLGSEGVAKESRTGRGLQPLLVPDSQRGRLVLAADRYLPAAAGTGVSDVAWRQASGLFLEDRDGDGRHDTAVLWGEKRAGLLVDADQDWLPDATPASALAAIRAGRARAEVSLHATENGFWAAYDLSGDGAFDVVLEAPDAQKPFARTAHRIAGGAQGEVAPEYMGRRIVDAALVYGAFATRTRAALRYLSSAADDQPGGGPLPDPMAFVRADGERMAAEVVAEGAMIVGKDAATETMIVLGDFRHREVPRESAAAEGLSLTAAITANEFQPSFAIFARQGLGGWLFYDTDEKDGFDVVLFDPSQEMTTKSAFRLGPGGPVFDAQLATGKPFRSSLFQSEATRVRFRKALEGFVKKEAIE